MNLTLVKTALDDFQHGSKDIHKNLLKPLARPTSHSREKELNDVYCKVHNEIKKIKDDVLNQLADGGTVDYEKIKSLFEKAELEMQEKKKDILVQFNSTSATIPTNTSIPVTSIQKKTLPSINIHDSKERSSYSTTTRDSIVSNKAKKRNQLATTSGSKKLDIEMLRNIINPARKDACLIFSKTEPFPKIQSFEENKKSKRSHVKPITGSTISHHHIDSLSNSRLTPPPPSSEDARKGILNLIQRKMIPAASSLTIDPSPIKHQQVVFHDISNKKMNKVEPRSQYNLSLVKFDKSTFNAPTALSPVKSSAISLQNKVVIPLQKDPSFEFDEREISNSSMGKELCTLKAFFPSSSESINRPSHKFIIQSGRTETSQDFVHFKQYYCLSWESINKLLDKLEKLLIDYSVPIAFVDGERLADMSLYFEIGPKPTMKDLLMCILNSSDVEKIICIPGRRYIARDGPDMAAVKIQAMWKGYYRRKVYVESRRKKWAAGLIALTWIMKCKLTYIKKHLKQMYWEYLLNYRKRNTVFKENWLRIKISKRVIIHIPSLGYPVSIRQNLSNLRALQNCQIGRISDIRDPNVEVIYICPLKMDEEMQGYYKRLVEIMCLNTGQDFENAHKRLKIFCADTSDKFPTHNLCLSSAIKYSDNLIKRIAYLIKGKDAYIVPGLVHKDDLYIAEKLDIPILGCEPDIAQLYSLKSGVHRVFESAGICKAPGAHDIYTRQQFDDALAKLVTQNLEIKRWLFKIDNQFDGKGTAFCDITPYLDCYENALKESERYGEKWKELWAHESIYNLILKELPFILERYATPVDQSVFGNWQEFMLSFLGEGGIIEACPSADSVTGITANVLIEPNGGIQILSVADQIHSTSPYQCWGHTLPQSSYDVKILNECITSISNACKSRGVLGYISIDFVTFIHPPTDTQELWAVGLKLSYSDCHAMVEMMKFLTDGVVDTRKNKLEVILKKPVKRLATYQSKYKKNSKEKEKLLEKRQRYAVLSPNLFHTNMNNIAYNIFLRICKAHGIAYDDKSKIGTSFTLINPIRRELFGMITIAANLHDAVSTFALNLVAIHNDISTPNMPGKNNFQGAVDDLKSILEALRINLEINQNIYPTMDPKDKRRIQSATSIQLSEVDDSNIRRVRSAIQADSDNDSDPLFDLMLDGEVTL